MHAKRSQLEDPLKHLAHLLAQECVFICHSRRLAMEYRSAGWRVRAHVCRPRLSLFKEHDGGMAADSLTRSSKTADGMQILIDVQARHAISTQIMSKLHTLKGN